MSRPVRIALATAMILTVCLGTAVTVEPTRILDAASTFAQRYHQRSRTASFYRRAGSGRTAGTSRGLFGR